MQEEYSQQDICNAWSLSKQTVNSIVSNMVKKGYVYLEMVPGSKNRKIICLTEEGRKFGEKVIYPLVFAEQKAFERIPLEEKAAIIIREKQGYFLRRKEIGKKMSKSVDKIAGVWYYT